MDIFFSLSCQKVIVLLHRTFFKYSYWFLFKIYLFHSLVIFKCLITVIWINECHYFLYSIVLFIYCLKLFMWLFYSFYKFLIRFQFFIAKIYQTSEALFIWFFIDLLFRKIDRPNFSWSQLLITKTLIKSWFFLV